MCCFIIVICAPLIKHMLITYNNHYVTELQHIILTKNATGKITTRRMITRIETMMMRVTVAERPPRGARSAPEQIGEERRAGGAVSGAFLPPSMPVRAARQQLPDDHANHPDHPGDHHSCFSPLVKSSGQNLPLPLTGPFRAPLQLPRPTSTTVELFPWTGRPALMSCETSNRGWP